MQQMTIRFTEALHQLHAEGDADALVACFSSDASLSKVDGNHRSDGKGGARQFWEDYRAIFDDIEATFTHVVQGEDSVALEWTSQGSLRTGRSFSYRGVSVLEGDGSEIRNFRTYYDSAAFLTEPAHRSSEQ